MATNLQTHESTEYCRFRVHYDKLLNAIQDPVRLAARLFSQRVITSAVKEYMNVPGVARLEKNGKLLNAVETQIRTNPSAFQLLMSALEEDPSMQSVVESMKGKCLAEDKAVVNALCMYDYMIRCHSSSA